MNRRAPEDPFVRSQGGYVVLPETAKKSRWPQDVQSWVQSINMAVQIIAIVGAGGWAIYTFWFKEIWLPDAAPLHLTLNAQMQRVSSDDSGSRETTSFIPVEVKITATNPSSKEGFLLPNVWMVLGKKITARSSSSFVTEANSALGSADQYAEAAVILKSFEVVAVGRLFGDYSLKPGESVTRTILVYVRSKTYNQLSVVAEVPATSKPDRVHESWTFDPKIRGLRTTMYRIDAKGDPIPIVPDVQGHDSDPEDGLQSVTARAELSL